MSQWLAAAFIWLSGAGCMWMWTDTHLRCRCGRVKLTDLEVRTGGTIHHAHRCQPYQEWLG